jgi:tetratricopeptide (TPR) repeat protein
MLKRRFDKKVFIEKIPFFILAAVFGYIAVLSQGHALRVGKGAPFMLFDQVMAALYGTIMYIYNTLVPINLSLIYPYPAKDTRFYSLCMISFVSIAALFAATLYSIRYTKKVIFGMLFTAITILPVLQIIPVGEAIMADRYTYLPSIGIFYIFGVGLSYVYGKKPALRGIETTLIGLVLIVLAILTYQRTGVWKDSFTIFTDTISKQPGAAQAYNNLGTAYQDRKDLDSAIYYYGKAIEVNPKYADSYYNRAYASQLKGDIDQAISDYGLAIKFNPGHPRAYLNRGNSYLAKGELDLALADYLKDISINPDKASAHNSLGVVYMNKGELDKSIAEYDKALFIDPTYATAYNNRAIAYYRKKEFQKSHDDIVRARSLGYRIDPQLLRAIDTAAEQ